MKTFQTWPRPVRICMAYLPVLVTMFACYWAVSGGNSPDASPHRLALYVAYFVAFPIGIAAFLIHLFATLGTPNTLKWRLAFSGLTGGLGMLLLYVSITTSHDGEAAMAYVGSVICFCEFAIAGFAVSTLAFYIIGVVRKGKSA